MTKRSSSLAAVLWLVVAVAALTRAPIWLLCRDSPAKFYRNDSAEYLALASNLSTHGVFSASSGPPWEPNLKRTPGYPAFIALVCSPFGTVRPGAVVAAQLLLAILTVVITARLAFALSGEPAAAACAGILLGLDAAYLEFNFALLSETLFTLLLLCGISLILPPPASTGSRRLVGGAFLLSVATIVRPVGLLIALPLAAAAWDGRRESFRRGLTRGAVLLAALFLLPALWSLRNGLAMGAWSLSTTWDIAALDRATNLESARTGQPLRVHRPIMMERLEEAAPRPELKGRAARRIALDTAARRPRVLVKALAMDSVKLLGGISLYNIAHLGSRRPFLRSEIVDLERERRAGDWVGPPSRFILERFPALRAFLAWHVAFLATLYGGALAGAVRLWRTNERLRAAVLGLAIAVLLCISVLLAGNYRFRVPALPLLAALSGVGWSTLPVRRRPS